MRKNTAKTLKAFLANRPAKPAAAIWTDGESIFSYSTCIATRNGDVVILNRDRYSRTTTMHQNGIAAWLPLRAMVDVRGLRRGCTRDDLLKAAGYHNIEECRTEVARGVTVLDGALWAYLLRLRRRGPHRSRPAARCALAVAPR